MNLFKCLVILLTTIATTAEAQLQLGQSTYAGTGCQTTGSASIQLSKDKKTLSILFNKFEALSGGSTGRRIDRKACALRLPIKIDAGYRLSFQATDYRAYVNMPVGGQAVLDASYSLIGHDEIAFNKNFNGGLKKIISAKNELTSAAGVASVCGVEDIMLGINVSARSVANVSMQKNQILLSSKNPVLVYKLKISKCP